MAEKNVNQMIRDVRSILEENVNSVPLEGVTDVGTISINTVIESILTTAVDNIAKVAPMELFLSPSVMSNAFTPFTPSTLTVVGIGTNGGVFSKPSDYLRMLLVNNETQWQRAVLDLTPLSSPYVSIARSDINLSVGNAEKPLAVDSFNSSGASIEIYPFKVGQAGTTDDEVTFVYIPRSTFTGSGSLKTIYCDENIYHAACFYAAYLVAMTKNYANAASYKSSAMDCINQVPNGANATSGAPVVAQA